MSLANRMKSEKNNRHILKSCEAAAMGAKRVILQRLTYEAHQAEALEIACETLSLAIREYDDKGFGDITLPRAYGCRNQLGGWTGNNPLLG